MTEVEDIFNSAVKNYIYPKLGTVGYSPQLGAYMWQYMWYVTQTQGIYVNEYVYAPKFQDIHHLSGIYVMYIRCFVYATIYPRNRGSFSSEAAGRGRIIAEVEGVYCCIYHEKATYIRYISHLEGFSFFKKIQG